MKKRIIIIFSLILIAITIVSLYQTFAIDSLVMGGNNTYNVTLTNNSTVSVPAKSSKTIYYQVTNTNKGIVRYGVGYISDNIVVKGYYDSEDVVTDTIDYGENKFIKLKLINDTNKDSEVEITTVLGYEFGGDLIPPDNVTLVTEMVGAANYLMAVTTSQTETSNFLRSTIKRNEISSVTFTDNNIVPDGYTGVDVSSNNDGTVMMWYGNKNSDNLYDIYIGAENGKVSLTSGNYLFSNLTNVKTIDFSNYIDTCKANDMYQTFLNCSKLINLDVSSFDTSKVTHMGNMFQGCSSLTELNINHFDTSKVTSLIYMFMDCINLKKLDVSKWDTSNVTGIGMVGIFCNCKSLQELDVSKWDTSNVTSLTETFQGCRSLTKLDISSWNTSKVDAMNDTFSLCLNIEYLDLSGWDTSKVTGMNQMFSARITGETMALKSIGDISGWNTSSLIDMSDMFYGCGNLTELDVSNFDTSKVTNMARVFLGCISLTELDVSTWDTSNVENMQSMFHDCRGLTTIDVRGFDTSKVTNMHGMFYGCNNLTSLDVSNFDTSKVTNMQGMFYGCNNLTSLDVSNFDTSKVTTMSYMFFYSTLTELDISNFDTSNVTNMNNMFQYAINLKTIYVSDKWNTESVTNSTNMFDGCGKLVGGNGTTYDSNYIDKTYARVDGGTSSPGYFTYKAASV